MRSLTSVKGWPICGTRAVSTPSSTPLDADRDLLQSQLDLRQTKLNELLSVVQLYKALGGGWQT